jgi:lipopolysaccharide heptosyltransferase II
MVGPATAATHVWRMTAPDPPTAKPYILVIGPSWVGDAVMAQSLFVTLKQRHPSCRIDVLAPGWSLSLLERMPEVSAAVEMPLGHGQFGFAARLKLARQLRAHQYDQAIVLPNSWKSALIPFLAGIPLRTGYFGEMRWGLLNDPRRLDKEALPGTVQRFVALGLDEQPCELRTFPLPKLNIDPNDQQRMRDRFSLAECPEKVVGLCPGAEFGPSKRWPADCFAALARQKVDDGWDVWLFGSGNDRAIADRIDQDTGGACRNFAGCTTVAEAVDLLSLTDCVVTNDSGLMHVAAALNKKVIALYGSSDPRFTPPLSRNARVISLQLDCSPCFERECPLGHYRCLRDITPQRVLAEMDRL